jgi:hypothetical protein
MKTHIISCIKVGKNPSRISYSISHYFHTSQWFLIPSISISKFEDFDVQKDIEIREWTYSFTFLCFSIDITKQIPLDNSALQFPSNKEGKVNENAGGYSGVH